MYEMMRAYFSDRNRSRLLHDRLEAGLSESERVFLDAAEIGNLDVIKDLLESGKVKVDCCDQQGRTALEMAVTGNDVESVSYLLARSSARHIHKTPSYKWLEVCDLLSGASGNILNSVLEDILSSARKHGLELYYRNVMEVPLPNFVFMALLAAADNDMERICELILDHPLYRESVRRQSMKHVADVTGIPGTEFSDDINTRFSHANLSKLLLEVLLRAAKRNNFQIVKKIMMCGVFLEEPHDYFCACAECTEWRREDFKVFTTKRLDTFTAMASPAYISLTAEDPILASFHLSQKFRRLSEIEGEYKKIYDQLDQQVQNFTLALLDQCQSSDEVKAILSGKQRLRDPHSESSHGMDAEKNSSSDDSNEGDILPLVYTAVRMEQKKFVAHPQCQAQIGEMWYSGVPFLRYLNRFAYLVLAIPIGLVCCPILSIIYLVSPWSKVSRIVNTPLMKFLSYTCSYLTFLILTIVVKLYMRHYIDTFSCDKPETFAYIVTTVIFMWIFGLIFEECKQIFAAGARDYFASFWNIIDSLMLSFLLASFVLELVTPFRLYETMRGETDIPQTQLQQPLPYYYPTINTSNILTLILPHGPKKTRPGSSEICAQAKDMADLPFSKFCQARHIDRFQVVWDPGWVPDPELLSDVLFSLGIIFSISRFSFIMPANEALGTMLVSFRRTVSDIVKIFGMFVLVLIAFTCGLAALYAPIRCYTGHFDSFSSTLSTLTWSMFGMGSVDVPSLKPNQRGPISSLTNNVELSTGAAHVGQYLYGIYVFCTAVVMLNLLIAVMSNTFQEVQDDRDVEWKFARTELWLTFIEPGTPVPPPFNIIPSPRHLWKVIMWMCRRSKFRHLLPHGGKKVRYAAVQTGSNLELNEAEGDQSEVSIEGHYTRYDVMCLLIRRYVRHIERVKIGEGDKTSNDEILRRLIERMSAKVEKRLDELQFKVTRVEREIEVVKAEAAKAQEVRQEHYDKFVEFTGRKTREKKEQTPQIDCSDRYIHYLDEAKLQILARMDSERIQMEKVVESRVTHLSRKLDDSSVHLTQQLERLRSSRGTGPASPSPGRFKPAD